MSYEQDRSKLNIENVEVYQYRNQKTFTEALVTGHPRRVFITDRGNPDWDKHTISFIDQSNSIHSFLHQNPLMSSLLTSSVYEVMPELTGQKLINGGIIVSTDQNRHAEIYQLFKPEVPYGFNQTDTSQIESENFSDWYEAATEAIQQNKTEIPYVQYYRNLETFSVDLTVGAFHFNTIIGLYKRIIIDEIQQAFPLVRFQDNTAAVNWGKVALFDMDI
jgi:hypothetical protein